VLLACAPAGFSQSTITTGQVLDPRGFPWQAGTGNFAIQCTGNSQPYINGSPVSRNIPLVRLDGTGSFTQSLWDTSFLTDTNGNALACQWRASFTDNCGVATFSVTFTGITGAGPVNVTSQITPVAVDLSAACTPPGIVNSVTLNNFLPVFTVANTGTAINPVFTFTAISEAPNLFYASPASGSGIPSFRAIQASDLPGSVGTVTSVSGLSPLFNVSNPTTTPTFTQIAQNPNLVFAGPGSGGAANPTFRALVGADLPTPNVTTLGGIESKTCPTSRWIDLITTSGTVTCTQPSVTDISGLNVTQISTGTNGSVCSTTNVAGNTCTTVVSISPTQADTAYIPLCFGQGAVQFPFILGTTALSTTSITVQITNGQGNQAQVSTFATLGCVAVHP
jgi:hypothetical protein